MAEGVPRGMPLRTAFDPHGAAARLSDDRHSQTSRNRCLRHPRASVPPRNRALDTASEMQLCALGFHISNTNDEALTKRLGCPRDRIERYRDVPRVQQAIQLRPARVKLPCHRLLGFSLFLHGLFELPSQHPLDCDRLDLLPNPFLFEKTIERGPTAVRSLSIFPYAHCSPLSCLLLLRFCELDSFAVSDDVWHVNCRQCPCT